MLVSKAHCDRGHAAAELDLGAQRVAMLDDWIAGGVVPDVQLDGAAALQQDAPVHVSRRAANELVLVDEV